MKVYFTSKARNDILQLVKYVTDEIKMPETALTYADKMKEFADKTIGGTHSAFSICRNNFLALQNLKCATFDKKWVFAFKVIKNKVVIFHVINGKLL